MTKSRAFTTSSSCAATRAEESMLSIGQFTEEVRVLTPKENIVKKGSDTSKNHGRSKSVKKI